VLRKHKVALPARNLWILAHTVQAGVDSTLGQADRAEQQSR